jgi:hypothetical protein
MDQLESSDDDIRNAFTGLSSLKVMKENGSPGFVV